MTYAEQAAFGALAVSILALVNSLRSNRISKSALDMVKQTFFGERSIALKSERGQDHLLLSAAAEGQAINNITIYFPVQLGIMPIVLTPPNFKLPDEKIVAALRAYWDSKTAPGFKRDNVPLPVVATVHGHTKGVATVTTGIYDLFATYVRTENNFSSVDINALTLNNYALATDDPQKLADKSLANVERVLSLQRP